MNAAERKRRIEVCEMIAADAEADVSRFEGQLFTGKNVAEYMACQAAAIVALAGIVKDILIDNGQTEAALGAQSDGAPLW